VPKRHKNVLVVTTAHDEPVVDGGHKRKPEAVLFYNEQRCGVDIMNKMIRELSTQPKTDDWRMCVFTFMIDVACINAWTILRYNMGKHDERRVFLKNLVHQLVGPWVKSRFLQGGLTLTLKTMNAMKAVLKNIDPTFDTEPKLVPKNPGKDARCFICVDEAKKLQGQERKKRQKDLKKIKWRCPKCDSSVCRRHRINLQDSLELVCKNCVPRST
jgi:hypothetical protein